MKKLIIATCIVCSAVAIQASTINWGMSGAISATDFATGTAYLVCVTDLAKPTFADDSAAKTWYSANKSSIAGAALLTTAVTDGAASGSEVVESPTGRKNYWLLIVSGDESHIAVSTTTKGITIGAGTMNAPATWTASSQMTSYSTTAVPEPTSGLLLLIGVAGLALKRKRA